MNEMIDRVAKAMDEKRIELINQPLGRIWPQLAQAAIEAMREPTEAMLSAANGPWTDDDRPELKREYQMMIDAALGVNVDYDICGYKELLK